MARATMKLHVVSMAVDHRRLVDQHRHRPSRLRLSAFYNLEAVCAPTCRSPRLLLAPMVPLLIVFFSRSRAIN